MSAAKATSSSTRSSVGVIPKEYIPAVNKGIQSQMKSGVYAGYPVVDVRVVLFDGSFHDVDSSEIAFTMAGSLGFREGGAQGRRLFARASHEKSRLSPLSRTWAMLSVISTAVAVPFKGWRTIAAAKIIRAFVPLAEMFGYATDLRSGDAGTRHLFDGNFPPTRRLPRNVAETAIKKAS